MVGASVLGAPHANPRGVLSTDRAVQRRGTFAPSWDRRWAAWPVRRRKLLGGLLAGGLGVFGIVLAFPLVRSLRALPGTTLDTTNWKRGSYLVDRQGRRVVASELAVGSVVSSVFPEGFQDNEEAQAKDVVILIRVAEAPLQNKGPRATWDPAGFLAYSKMCTHAGCPVGLYERQLELLICPCPQSMFDVANNATPIFGPAPRPLPQLPSSMASP